MKILRTLLLFFLCISINSAFAQTKEETEQWINGKMKLYQGTETTYKAESLDFYRSFENFKLNDGKISVEIKQRSYSKGRQKEVRNTVQKAIDMPVNMISYVSFKYDKRFNAVELTIAFVQGYYYDNHRKGFHQGDPIDEKGMDDLIFYIPNKEDNIGERLEKAFKHYATFFPKEKETF